MNTDLSQIESQCQAYDRASNELEYLIANLEEDLNKVKQKHLRGLKKAAATVAGLEAALTDAIGNSPQLFEKPRTVVLHGVKVGFTSSVGKLEFDDADTVLAHIRKLFPEEKDLLIRTKHEPNKDALRNLSAQDLAKLNCRIVDAGDLVLVKRMAGDVEKLVGKLIDRMVEAMVDPE